MANDPAYDYYGNSPGPWGRLRARWSLMPSAYRYNAVLYGLAVIALGALVLEVAFGQSSPRFEIATQVVPVASSTTRPPATSTSTTTASSTTTTSTSTTVAAAGTPLGSVTPTTKRKAASGSNPAPGGGGNSPPAGDSQGNDVPVASTFAPVTPPSNPTPTSPRPTTQQTTPATSPTQTGPTRTLPSDICSHFPPGTPGCP